VVTGRGDDLVCGSTGANTIDTVDGHDVESGGSGNDVLRGDAGDESLSATAAATAPMDEAVAAVSARVAMTRGQAR
jgi:Ca2+-binding RTX toxin-like protein